MTRTDLLIDHLQGTCLSLEQGCAQLEIDPVTLTDDEHQQIAQHIFECANCGWWREVSEAHDHDGEDVCDDCAEDLDLEEE